MFSISSFDIISVIIIHEAESKGLPEPKNFLCNLASAAYAAAVNPNGINTLFVNGLITFFINVNPIFMNGPISLLRNPTNPIIL